MYPGVSADCQGKDADWRPGQRQRGPPNPQTSVPKPIPKGELNFGFSSVTVKVYKSDAAAGARPVDKPVEQDAASEIEASDDHTETDPEGYSTDGTLRCDFEAMCCHEEVEDDPDADITVVKDTKDVLEAPSDQSSPL
ncbi:GL14504 [Drosophila persimilis]|uniref:GL14504 n=1 Tax=Drosophila persimilis TaxID=7234 RepID=B4HCK4_DROPE|nr:GL14504 [Drosophila persimilis]